MVVLVVLAPVTEDAIADPLLDAAERLRCSEYRLTADRARHATGRVVAKRLVGERLGVAAAEVAIVPDTAEQAGRPRVRLDDGRDEPVRLSISHAGDWGAVAVGERPVGVDIQDIPPVGHVLASPLVYGLAEQEQLADTPPAWRVQLAAQWWTAKEAALKFLGCGLGVDPATVDVRAEIVAVQGVRIRVMRLEAPRGYAASLAVAADDVTAVEVRTLRYDDVRSAAPTT